MEIQMNMYCHLNIAFNKWKSPLTLQVNCICQLGRKTNLPMGGIQIIVLGDFYQLPPVPNKWVQDPGHYCFKSSICKHLIPHKFLLQEVHRQHDTIFINAVGKKNVWVHSLNSLKSRETHLFSRRVDTHIYNHTRLSELTGTQKIYESIEVENITSKMRRAVTAPHHLALKVNAPVILTVNVKGSHDLVNGLQGTVVELKGDSVVVNFPFPKTNYEITRHQFFINKHCSSSPIFICA